MKFLLKTEIHANQNAPSEMMWSHCAEHTGRTEDNRKASVKYCCVINPATFDSKGYAMMSTCRRQKNVKTFYLSIIIYEMFMKWWKIFYVNQFDENISTYIRIYYFFIIRHNTRKPNRYKTKNFSSLISTYNHAVYFLIYLKATLN